MPEATVELTGHILNLPEYSTPVKCPACGTIDRSDVREEPSNDLGIGFNVCKLFCLTVPCYCFLSCIQCTVAPNFGFLGRYLYTDRTDYNHYCKSCNCFFGRGKP